MANTKVLNLETANIAGGPVAYAERVEDDRIENANRDKIDAFAGFLTASFCEFFFVSGAFITHVGQGSDIGGEFYGGLRYNPGPARHIEEVQVWCRNSGSNADGVTVIDVQKIAAGALPTSNESLFSNLAYKPVLSASEGDGSAAAQYGYIFAAGSSSWAAGEMLGVVIESSTVGANAQDLCVLLKWKPSASYGV